MLKHFAIDGKDLRSKIEVQLAQLVKPDAHSQLTLSDEGRRIILRAYNESRRLRSEWVEAEHILLALTREEKDTPVGKVLAESGLEGNTLCSEIISLQQRRRKERRAKYLVNKSLLGVKPSVSRVVQSAKKPRND